MTRQPTCEERIDAELADRAKTIGAYLDVIETDTTPVIDGEIIDAEKAEERLNELPLSANTSVLLHIDLSTGGPADYLKIELSREDYGWSVSHVEYHFADWFDHAQRTVDEGSPLWRFAERYAELASDIGIENFR